MTTDVSLVRSKGGRDAATPGAIPVCYQFSFTATQTPAALTDATGGSLTVPSGFVLTDVLVNAAATGGTDPTFLLGISTDTDAFVAAGDADAGPQAITYGSATAGASMGVKLTADGIVYGGKGASAPTGGTVSGIIRGVVYDTGGHEGR
jgi:hypothetical protein